MSGPDLPDAPTVSSDTGEPMPRYRLALTVLVDSHGVDPIDASHRAMAALRIPGGPFPHTIDHVSGPGQRWWCHADVIAANTLHWRQLDDQEQP